MFCLFFSSRNLRQTSSLPQTCEPELGHQLHFTECLTPCKTSAKHHCYWARLPKSLKCSQPGWLWRDSGVSWQFHLLFINFSKRKLSLSALSLVVLDTSSSLLKPPGASSPLLCRGGSRAALAPGFPTRSHLLCPGCDSQLSEGHLCWERTHPGGTAGTIGSWCCSAELGTEHCSEHLEFRDQFGTCSGSAELQTSEDALKFILNCWV